MYILEPIYKALRVYALKFEPNFFPGLLSLAQSSPLPIRVSPFGPWVPVWAA